MGESAIEGIVLAAGFGKRMLPLSAEIPKPLLPVTGVTALEIAAGRLARAGARRIHVNLHHLGETIRSVAGRRGWDFVFHPERELLGTGGGIGAMADDLPSAGTILLHNGDVVSSIGYAAAMRFHRESGALVTLILLRPGEDARTPPAAVTLAADGTVTAIASPPRPPRAAERLLGYTGLAIIDAAALAFFPRRGRHDLVGVLREMIGKRPGSVAGWEAGAGPGRDRGAAANESAAADKLDAAANESAAADKTGVAADEAAWGEIGTPAGYLDIHRRILVEKTRFDPLIPPPLLPLRAGPGSKIDPGARWNGFLDIGAGAVIERDTALEDCIVMDGATVRNGSVLRAAVAHRGGVMEVR